ncbi:MAG: hypoxanthine phosphoribosyltransferase [Cryomorphaceae bacterium BACL11 MAG-121001-bin54]|mgnify:FL=1|jgi:hypoxanthine phosphoribosyltransferase|nr:MAG: hypoxanthine phosphoribosyltransferase [Cryomorphaceae bacterium BACL11 MAG-121001-bin54]KRO63375.1 MAG: hypoxanthine phosphoribosyltransferase [Cryomorphaceae bacterium BACL11 MAG-121015-bin20]
MKTIILNNKTFEVSISDTEISAIVDTIANNINATRIKDPIFIAVMNGAFLFAADVMRKITIPNAEISLIKLSSYSGTKTTGEVNELIGIGQNIKDRNVIVLEDIIDTGITLERIIALLEKENVATIKVATLLFKPKAYTKEIHIDFIGKSIPNDFVVGYGLDYDEIGRNLPHIYKLKE